MLKHLLFHIFAAWSVRALAECNVNGDGVSTCPGNDQTTLLQSQTQVSSAPVINGANDRNAKEAVTGITWVEAKQNGDDCHTTCAAHGSSCSEDHLVEVTEHITAQAAFTDAGVTCNSFAATSWNVDYVHMTKCNHPMCCGGQCVGACNYQTDVKATCASKVPELGDGYHLQRLCPCKKVEWVLQGPTGDSCNSTCAAHNKACSDAHLVGLTEHIKAQAAFTDAGVTCNSVAATTWNVDYVHMSKCTHPMCCGGNCVGACNYQTDVKATCASKVPKLADGYHLQRLCPCA